MACRLQESEGKGAVTPSRTVFAVAAVLAGVLAGCSPGKPVKLPIKLPGAAGPAGPFDRDRLESAIDGSFGGTGTCVVLAETGSGREVYRYNSNAVCMNPLPPCSTFKIANSLIGLDAGVVNPQTVFKWDRKPQPIKAWEQDADMKTAFKESIVWWYQKVASAVGKPAFEERLKAFDYGDKTPSGPLTSFWLGPAAGGGLGISTLQQAQFLHRLYAGLLPVKPDSAAYVQSIMVDEVRGAAVISGKTGSCATVADGSRQVGWWVGRLKTPKLDYVFAASMEGDSDNALPGREVQARVKSAFAKAGLWPDAP